MALFDISLLVADNDFIMRTRACVATEGISNPVEWTNTNMWAMAATPSFGDKYAYAIATNVAFPGRDPAVIADEEILSAVQAIEAGIATG